MTAAALGSSLPIPTMTRRRLVAVGSKADPFSMVRIRSSAFVMPAALTSAGSPGSFATASSCGRRVAATASAQMNGVMT
jgi:hypothetical protein